MTQGELPVDFVIEAVEETVWVRSEHVLGQI